MDAQQQQREIHKIRDLLEMGFIGEEEYARRAKAILGTDVAPATSSSFSPPSSPTSTDDTTDYYSSSKTLGYAVPDDMYAQPSGAHGISEFISTHSTAIHHHHHDDDSTTMMTSSTDEAVYNTLYSSMELPSNMRAALESSSGSGGGGSGIAALVASPVRHAFVPVAQSYREDLLSSSGSFSLGNSSGSLRGAGGRIEPTKDGEEHYAHIFTSPVVPPAASGGKEAWNWKEIQPHEFVVVYRSREGYFRSPPFQAGMRMRDLLELYGMKQGRLVQIVPQSTKKDPVVITANLGKIAHGLYRLELAEPRRRHRTGLSFRVYDSSTTTTLGQFEAPTIPLIALYTSGNFPSALHSIVVLYSSHTGRDRLILRYPFPSGTTMQQIASQLCRTNFSLRRIGEDESSRVEFPFSESTVVPDGDYRLIQPQTVIKRDLYHHTFIVDSTTTSKCTVPDIINTYTKDTAPKLRTPMFPEATGSGKAPRSLEENRAFMESLSKAFNKRKTQSGNLELHFTLRLRLLQQRALAVRTSNQNAAPTPSLPSEWFKNTTLPQLDKAIGEGRCIVTGEMNAEPETFLSGAFADAVLMDIYRRLKAEKPHLWNEQENKGRDLRVAFAAAVPASRKPAVEEEQEVVINEDKFQLVDWKRDQPYRRHEISELVQQLRTELANGGAGGDNNAPGDVRVSEQPVAVPSTSSPARTKAANHQNQHHQQQQQRRGASSPVKRGYPTRQPAAGHARPAATPQRQSPNKTNNNASNRNASPAHKGSPIEAANAASPTKRVVACTNSPQSPHRPVAPKSPVVKTK